jgi:Cu/Zn superoxide dismutase
MRRHRARLIARRAGRPAGVRLALVAASVVLASCSSTSQRDAPPPTPAQAQANVAKYGLEAQLRSLDSAVTGKVRVYDQGDGIRVLVSVISMPDVRYRVAFHQDPNCRSPNGFAAGPHWAPAGRDPRNLMPALSTNQDGTAESSLHVSGVHIAGPDGIQDRSVIIYTGERVTDAVSGVPNNRVACGTFTPVQPFAF